MSQTELAKFLKNQIKKLEEKKLLRETKVVDRTKLIDFSSNDYLGLGEKNFSPSMLYSQEVQEILLANHNCPEEEDFSQIGLWDQIKESSLKFEPLRIGSTASRLLTGTYGIHEELENFIASWKHSEAAISFGSGYLANLGAISALLGPKDVVFSDELNHACILDGIRLSGAKKFFYKHNDIQHLEELLSKNRSDYEKAIVITDSIFSMDGDVARLEEIVELKNKYNFSIYVDEAHATGVLGTTGAGLVEKLVEENKINYSDIEIQMGTFSKAAAVEGAYIAGSRDLIIFLKNSARTFMFSTAYSPLIARLILDNLKLLMNRKDLREKLHKNIDFFRKELSKLPALKWQNEKTSIFSIFVGDNEASLAASEELIAAGLLVLAIREPTVPSPRLRVCLSAKHSVSDLKKLSAEILELSKKIGESTDA